MTNVIEFPQKTRLENELKRVNPPLTQKERLELDVMTVTNEVVSELMYYLYEIGYELDQEKHTEKVSLIYDSVRSLLLSIEGLEHPYQDFAQVIYGEGDAEFSFDIE